jgi:serine/threonine protein kinase
LTLTGIRKEEEWKTEAPVLEGILPKLGEALEGRYSLIKPLGVGGVGIVLQVLDINLDTHRALKFARPTAGKETMFAEVIASEISHLREAEHQNVIGIFYKDTIQTPSFPIPFYIMEQIQGASDAAEYFEALCSTQNEIELFRGRMLNVLTQAISGLAHMHSIGMLHGDMKLENILVGENGRAVISDLGSARRLDALSSETQVIFTRPYAHPKLIELAARATTSTTDPNRVRAPIARSDLRLAFDLFALGKNVVRLLNSIEQDHGLRLDHYTRKYLRLMACRMLDGENTDLDLAIGLPRDSFKEIKYINAREVDLDLRKLTGEYSLTLSVPEMDSYSVQTIQSASSAPTPQTSRLTELISHPLVGRLANISQLGFLSLVYPTARHSRFEHVLGTFTNTIQYCKSLYHDELNPLFKQIMTEDDIVSILLAALLHDLGQYPLAHDLEDTGHDLFAHDLISVKLLNGDYKSPYADSLRELIRSKWHVEPERVANIIDADPRKMESSIKDRLLHTIISGPIDADKLDYLMRDAAILNVPFPRGIDYDRLLQCLTVVYRPVGRGLFIALGIHEKGKFPAESVAFARYTMFGAAYWHHTSRACKAMLHRAVWESLPPVSQRAQYGDYRESLLATALGEDPRQGNLFGGGIQEFQLTSHPQVMGTDRAMAEWIWARTTLAGRELLEMLVSRNLFKRIMVFSKRSGRTWTRLTKFRGSAIPADQVKLQVAIQRRAVERLQEQERDKMRNPGSAAVGESVVANLAAAQHRGQILMLIDIPTSRSGSQVRLEYVPETNRRDILEEWSEPVPLEDSVIWSTVYENFLDSVGKIRILCHPEFRDTFDAGLNRGEYEKIIIEGLDEIEGIQ